MSNLIRWQPMREMVTLRDAMDRLFDEAFTRPWGLTDGGQYGVAPQRRHVRDRERCGHQGRAARH